jgi:triacylglycerol esterase/lipase EstA (alpha/beta hydrolase family)
MIALLALAGLLAALGAWAAIACWLWRAAGVSAVGSAIAAAAAVLALQFALVALACALARRWRAPASAPLGAPGFVRLAAGEALAFLRTWFAGQLLQPWLAPRDPGRIVRGVVPVLFVHGIYCNAGVWYRLLAFLRGAGTPNLFCVNLAPPLAGIDHFAAQLARRAGQVCQACGTQRIIVVAHSMGGLVARAWRARLGGQALAACMVSIATPHRGSRLAGLVPGRCAAEMVPGGEWLARLEADEAGLPGVSSSCIFSWHDSLVAPQDSALLPGAQAMELERLGHMQLLLEPAVHREVAAQIAAARARSGSPS